MCENQEGPWPPLPPLPMPMITDPSEDSAGAVLQREVDGVI